MGRLSRHFPVAFTYRENILFFLLNVVYFSSTSIYFGFLIMYLTAQGYSSFECGIFNTLISLATLIVQPLAGYLTDTYLTIKKYLILSGIAIMACTFLLPLTVHIPVLAAISILIMSALVNPATFLADTWSVTLREQYPWIDYGKTRSGGSFGYSITSIAAGYLVAPLGYNFLFGIHVLLFLFYIIIVSLIPSVPCRNVGKHAAPSENTEKEPQQKTSLFQAIGILLNNKQYRLFLVSAIFYYIALKAFVGNVSYKVLDLNGTDSHMGICLATAAIFEVPFLFLINRFVKQYKLSFLYLFSVSCILIRGILMAAAPTMPILYISQALQACTYGVFVATSLELVSRVVPSHIRATAVTFMVAMTNGLGAIIGSFFAGVLIEQFGVDFMCWVMTGSVVIALILYGVPVVLRYKKDPNSVV